MGAGPRPGVQRGDKVELYSCFSRDAAKREAFQQEFSVPNAASSYEELLADPMVEGVLVTTPNDTHMEMITKAIRAGKAVYTDKPIAHTRGRQPDRDRGPRIRSGLRRRAQFPTPVWAPRDETLDRGR